MLRGHMTGIIQTSCLKQIKSLEFHIVAKFANLRYTLMQGIKSFVVQPHFHARRSRDLYQKFTKSSEMYVATKFGKQSGLFTRVTNDFRL